MSDFQYEYNDQGEWCLAWEAERNDENNRSFLYYKSGVGVVNTDGFVPKGTAAGHWRHKQ